jgi:hypothetical protein
MFIPRRHFESRWATFVDHLGYFPDYFGTAIGGAVPIIVLYSALGAIGGLTFWLALGRQRLADWRLDD